MNLLARLLVLAGLSAWFLLGSWPGELGKLILYAGLFIFVSV